MMGTTKVLLLRTLREPTALALELRAILLELDPNLPLHSIATLASVVDDSYRIERQLSSLLAALGAAAVAVTLIGLYGMIGYALQRRTREVSIRITVGAKPSDVSRLFVVNGLSVVLAGVCLGLWVSLLSTRYLSRYLYDLSSTDPLTWIAVAGYAEHSRFRDDCWAVAGELDDSLSEVGFPVCTEWRLSIIAYNLGTNPH